MNYKIPKKMIIVALIVGLIAVFEIFKVGDYLTLSYIKESQRKFEILYSERPLLVMAAFYDDIYPCDFIVSARGCDHDSRRRGALRIVDRHHCCFVCKHDRCDPGMLCVAVCLARLGAGEDSASSVPRSGLPKILPELRLQEHKD